MTPPPRLVAVAAVARNGVIGRDGAMPWTLATDLARYRRLTMDKPMIMGRRTFASIGKVLDGRDSVVLTRTRTLPVAGAHPAGSPEEAVAVALRLAEVRGAQEIVVVGGAEIYALFFGRLSRLFITHVGMEPEGDATFPKISPDEWNEVSGEDVPGRSARRCGHSLCGLSPALMWGSKSWMGCGDRRAAPSN